jgi:predicted transglutaminase-like cysteine proteinase
MYRLLPEQLWGAIDMGRSVKILAVAAALIGFVPQQSALASFYSLPGALGSKLSRIQANVPTLAPMAFTQFCMRYAQECEVKRMPFRGGGIKLSPERLAELREINLKVNRSIKPERNAAGLGGERWVLSPASGDCNDYAVTKRHELLARGWPSHGLLLAEVVTSWGEHHLVLVIRTSDGDIVADSLNHSIKPWSKTQYRWVRMQSPKNPKFWSSIGQRAA